MAVRKNAARLQMATGDVKKRRPLRLQGATASPLPDFRRGEGQATSVLKRSAFAVARLEIGWNASPASLTSDSVTFWVFLTRSWLRSPALANSDWSGANAGTASKPLKKLLVLVMVSILWWAARTVFRAAVRVLRRTVLARRAVVFCMASAAAAWRLARRALVARAFLAVSALDLAIFAVVSATASITLAGASAAAWASTLVWSAMYNDSSGNVALHKYTLRRSISRGILCAAPFERLTSTARPKQERTWTPHPSSHARDAVS